MGWTDSSLKRFPALRGAWRVLIVVHQRLRKWIFGEWISRPGGDLKDNETGSRNLPRFVGWKRVQWFTAVKKTSLIWSYLHLEQNDAAEWSLRTRALSGCQAAALCLYMATHACPNRSWPPVQPPQRPPVPFFGYGFSSNT